MTSPELRAVLAGVLVFAMGLHGPAEACGPPPDGPSYIDAFGGQTADLNAFYDGRVGVVMAQSPRAQLFMAWRLLHGLPVGQAAGAGDAAGPGDAAGAPGGAGAAAGLWPAGTRRLPFRRPGPPRGRPCPAWSP